MIETSTICKAELELDYINNGSNSNKLIKRLIFYCIKNENCKNRHIFQNSTCTVNSLKVISSIEKIDEITFKNDTFLLILNENSTYLLNEFLKFIKKIENIKLKNKKYNKSCLNYNKCQKNNQIFINRLFGTYPHFGLIYHNPIKAFIEINNEIRINIRLIEKNVNCKKCLKSFIKSLQKIISSLKKLEFIKKYCYLTPIEKNDSDINIYTKIFNLKLVNREEIIKDKDEQSNFHKEDKLIKNYIIGPYKIQIYNEPEKDELLYVPSKLINFDKIPLDMLRISDLMNNKIEFFKLNKLLNYNIKTFTRFFQNNGKTREYNNDKLIQLLSFENLGLNKIIPLLLDNNIEEIYLDSPNSNIYIDHSIFGRCNTKIKLNSEDIENFKTRIRLENNSFLDEKHPQLKTDLYTDYFNVRVSCNIRPLAVDRFNFSIRKLRKKLFSIIELLNFNTISISAVAYLCFNLFHKRNIIVIGAPGAGKTTLINSLDMLTPNNWRKIYLEDVIESINQSKFGKHQVRFNVSSNLKEEDLFSKSIQVRETLHRSPDMIFIGELIHKETVKAFFFLLKTGLRCGLGTCHGESPKLIIQRWIEDDGIPEDSIKNLDVVVQIAKTEFGRRVIKIVEIGEDKKNGNQFKIKNIFLRDPKNDTINPNFDSLETLFKESIVLNKMNSLLVENISEKNFIFEIRTYERLFELLKTYKIYTLEDVVYYFNKFWILYSNLKKNHKNPSEKLNSKLNSLFKNLPQSIF